MTPVSVTPPPAPSFLSDAARVGLEQPIVPTQYPALDDRPGWEQWVGQTDAMVAEMLSGMPPLADSELRDIAGVPTYVLTPKNTQATDDAPVYLTFHGGALVMGGGDLTRVMAEFNVAVTGIVNWAPDYRMPPAHPYPAALDDAIAVYRALLQVRDPSRIAVGGGSAGGNLAAALLLRAKDEGLPMPAALVLLTPEIDLTESGDSFTTLAHVSVGLQTLREVNQLYAGGHDLTDPYLSPLFGDLTEFPPTLLIGGTRDLFLSNTVRMHRKLREAGVDADLHIFDGRPHAGYGNAPEEAAVSAEQAAFVRRHLGLQ
jgi:monoterpene epsilon-lactone hydrolase